MIKLIATDIDGTLVDDDKNFPPDMSEVIDALHNNGIHFVAASGRSYVTLANNFSPWLDKIDLICDNGAYVVSQGKVIAKSTMDIALSRAALRACLSVEGARVLLCGQNGAYHLDYDPEFNRHVSIFYNNKVTVGDIFAVEDEIFKIAVFHSTQPMQEVHAKITQEIINRVGDRLDTIISGDQWMDIMLKGVTKGHGLRMLQAQYGVSKSETMAFGDYNNDIDMLNTAEHSYAMQNACEDAKRTANYIAPSNNDFGVMEVIRENVLLNLNKNLTATL